MSAVSPRANTHNSESYPEVSIIIPSIGRQALLDELLDAIQSGTKSRVEVIVSHSGPWVPTVGPAVHVLHSDVPLLASAARNRGAASATGQYLLFVDDDNEIESGVVDSLKECLDREPGIAVLGPSMYYAGDRTRPYCFGVLHGSVLGRTRFIVSDASANGGLVWSDALPNVFMVRRDAFTSARGFDEQSFPMNFEESDLQYRLCRQTSGRVACLLAVRVWHHTPLRVSERLAPKGAVRFYLSARNRPIFIARHLGWTRWLVFLGFGQFLFGAVRIGAALRDRRVPSAARARLVGEYMRGMAVGVVASCMEVRRRKNGTAGIDCLGRSSRAA